MNFKVNKLTFLLASCVYGLSFAQTAVQQTVASGAVVKSVGEQAGTLPETMVTATRTAHAANETSGATFVITRQDIESRNLTSIDNALNNIPGVFNRRGKGAMDTLASISLRGMPDQKRTLIMQDGMPLNGGYTGGVAYSGLAIEDFSQVEVALGAAASLYGNNAMGGVVNYVSRMPTKREFKFKLGYGDGLDEDAAMRNLKRAYVSFGDKFSNGLSIFASATATGTTGYPTGLNVQSAKPPATLGGWSETSTSAGAVRYLIGDKGGNNHWKEGGVTLRAAIDLPDNGELRVGYQRNQYEYGRGMSNTYLRNAAGQPVWGYGTVRESSFLDGSGKKTSDLFQGSLETGLGKGRLRINAGYSKEGTNWYTTPGATAATTYAGGPGSISSTPSNLFYADAQYTFTPVTRHLVVLGGSWRQEKADNTEHRLSDWRNENSKQQVTYVAGGKTRTAGIFVQDEFAMTDKFTTTLGLRWDHWQSSDGYSDSDGVGTLLPMVGYPARSGNATSPKLGLRYQMSDNLALRASVGKAFRAPNVYELFRTWRSSTGTVYEANPNLKPETAVSWDMGADFRPWAGADVKATFYMNHLKDMIYRGQVAAGRQRYFNAGKAKGHGVELDFRQKIGSGWTLLANAAYNKTEIEENTAAPNSVGKEFTQIPKVTANLGAEWNRGDWNASGWVQHVAKRYSSDSNDDRINGVNGSYDAYTIANLKAGYRISKNLKLSFAVDNVFNKKYFASYRAPGRSYFLELAGEF